MRQIIFKENYIYNDKHYSKGKALKLTKKDKLSDIWKLNEEGIIEPLTKEEFKEIVNKINKKKEDDINE